MYSNRVWSRSIWISEVLLYCTHYIPELRFAGLYGTGVSKNLDTDWPDKVCSVVELG